MKKTLYRGDRQNKGPVLKPSPNYVLNGKAKNLAGWYFFTDTYQEAVSYATGEMNRRMQHDEVTEPTITTVEADTAHLLDLSQFGDNLSISEAYRILSKLHGSDLTMLEAALLGFFGSGAHAYLAGKPKDKVEEVSRDDIIASFPKVKGEEAYPGYEPRFTFVHLGNFETGLHFKKWLIERGYKGFVFKDTAPTLYEGNKPSHYAFIDKVDISVIEQKSVLKPN